MSSARRARDAARRGAVGSELAPSLWHLAGLADGAQRPPVAGGGSRGLSMVERYRRLVEEMKREHGIRVRKWRRATSGCAWQLLGSDGSVSRLIEAPYPRGPVSCAVFLHEVGHHAIGFDAYRLRCQEEYHAWRWSITTMRERGFTVSPAVVRRVRDALAHAVAKAARRGLRSLPEELADLERVRWLAPEGAAGE